MKKVFIGIDFSKLKFDVAIYLSDTKEIVSSNVFDNELPGYKQLIKWINKTIDCNKADVLFCGEHTGYYSSNLSVFLHESGYDLWLVSGLQIKLSQGIKREKTDKIDACHIAQYACRFEDKVVLFTPVSSTLEQLRDLLSYRDRLVEFKKILKTSAGELKRVRSSDSGQYICDESLNQIKQLSLKIRDCEKRIEALIKQDISLATNYKLMNTVKGIGMVNAVLILIATANFTLFLDPRKFGCYCGVVPFKHSSGTSVRGKTRVSQMANKKIKTALTQAARNSVMYDPLLKEYYQKKRSEGKTDALAINNVRNKLIHRIFAVVRSGQNYDLNYTHSLKQQAA